MQTGYNHSDVALAAAHNPDIWPASYLPKKLDDFVQIGKAIDFHQEGPNSTLGETYSMELVSTELEDGKVVEGSFVITNTRTGLTADLILQERVLGGFVATTPWYTKKIESIPDFINAELDISYLSAETKLKSSLQARIAAFSDKKQVDVPHSNPEADIADEASYSPAFR